MTDDLIASLSTNLIPVRTGAVVRRITIAVAIGLVISTVGMVLWLGLRSDLAEAVLTPVFWIKFGYGTALAMTGFFMVRRLAQPGLSGRRPLIAAACIFGVAALLGAIQIGLSPAQAREALIMGSSAFRCPLYIVALSLPFLVVNIVTLRSLAPTNLPLAGFAAGLMAGALGAWVYAFHCGEEGLPFLAIWYTLGILFVGAIGALLGRFAMRW
jgi:hypothetical protein